jgi:hypothetical protein
MDDQVDEQLLLLSGPIYRPGKSSFQQESQVFESIKQLMNNEKNKNTGGY